MYVELAKKIALSKGVDKFNVRMYPTWYWYYRFLSYFWIVIWLVVHVNDLQSNKVHAKQSFCFKKPNYSCTTAGIFKVKDRGLFWQWCLHLYEVQKSLFKHKHLMCKWLRITDWILKNRNCNNFPSQYNSLQYNRRFISGERNVNMTTI